MGAHLIDGQFQSDKYPTTPRNKVPLSVRDPLAQDLLWEYARRHRVVDAEFSDDAETALRVVGYEPGASDLARADQVEARLRELDQRDPDRLTADEAQEAGRLRNACRELDVPDAGVDAILAGTRWSGVDDIVRLAREIQRRRSWGRANSSSTEGNPMSLVIDAGERWTIVHQEPDEQVIRRYPVPGGWLYQVSIEGEGECSNWRLTWHRPTFVQRSA